MLCYLLPLLLTSFTKRDNAIPFCPLLGQVKDCRLLLIGSETVQEIKQCYACTFSRFRFRRAAVAKLLSLDQHRLIFLNGKTQNIVRLEAHMLAKGKGNGDPSSLTQNPMQNQCSAAVRWSDTHSDSANAFFPRQSYCLSPVPRYTAAGYKSD